MKLDWKEIEKLENDWLLLDLNLLDDFQRKSNILFHCKQDRFTTYFKTWGTGTLLKGLVQSPFDAKTM